MKMTAKPVCWKSWKIAINRLGVVDHCYKEMQPQLADLSLVLHCILVKDTED